MARRWRIRHKLMLGMVTVVAILGMLLAGTLNGLWAYYVTMKSIDSKLIELDKAELFKTSVAALALPEKMENSRQEAADLERRMRKAQMALGDYTEAFQTTLDRELTPDDGHHIRELINALNEQFERLRKANRPVTITDADIGPISSQDLLHSQRLRYRQEVQKQIRDLEATSADLRDAIREGLRERIRKSRRHYQISLTILLSMSTLSLVLMASLVRFFYGWVFYPVRDLQEGVGRVANGDFDHRIELASGDEMEELAAAFNDMTERLQNLYTDMARQVNERSRQLVRSERLASVGFLAAGVAHEINNPLASIAFCSEALEARLGELNEQMRRGTLSRQDLEIFGKYLKMIQEEALRCKNITEHLLEFSRGGERTRERTDLVHLVQGVLDVTQTLQNSKGKEIRFDADESLYAWVNAEELKSVVLNLVVNALDSMDEGGKLTLALHPRDGMAELIVRDTGCGMTEEVLENIFEPFFTRNRSGKGTGLGLTITHRIISQHGGEIEASSPGADQGSTFCVRLPLQPPETGKEESLGHAAA